MHFKVRKQCKVKKKYDQNNKPTLSVIKKVGIFVQQCEEWNLLVEDAEVKLEREEESEAPNVLPEPPKKKRRTKKTDITSMERIDSYMSNTYLGRIYARDRSDPESSCQQNLLREKQAKEEEKEERREDRREE